MDEGFSVRARQYLLQECGYLLAITVVVSAVILTLPDWGHSNSLYNNPLSFVRSALIWIMIVIQFLQGRSRRAFIKYSHGTSFLKEYTKELSKSANATAFPYVIATLLIFCALMICDAHIDHKWAAIVAALVGLWTMTGAWLWHYSIDLRTGMAFIPAQ